MAVTTKNLAAVPRVAKTWLVAAVAVLSSGCAQVPPQEGHSPSTYDLLTYEELPSEFQAPGMRSYDYFHVDSGALTMVKLSGDRENLSVAEAKGLIAEITATKRYLTDQQHEFRDQRVPPEVYEAEDTYRQSRANCRVLERELFRRFGMRAWLAMAPRQ
ncbi:MAG: hypothetical protein AAF581_14235 [Planctomycetota bacterium]